MVLYDSLLNTQHYMVQIKGKVVNLDKGVVHSPTAIEKGAFGSPSTTGANFTFSLSLSLSLYIYIYIYSIYEVYTETLLHSQIWICETYIERS